MAMDRLELEEAPSVAAAPMPLTAQESPNGARETRPPRRGRSRLPRRLAYGVGAVLAMVLLVRVLRPSPVEVGTARVDRGPLRVTVNEEGFTRVVDRYRVAAPIAGRLLRLELREGDVVGRGESVARIAAAPLDPRTEATAAARVSGAVAMLGQARAREAQARGEAEQAARELPRRQELAEAGALSREAMERAELLSNARRREWEAAVAAVDGAAAEVAAARAALGDASSGGAARVVELRAPAAGRVLRIPEVSERTVAPGEPLLEIGEAEAMELVMDVLSTDAVLIHPGMAILVTDWGGEEELRGVVTRVEPEAFTRVSALGVEERRVHVVGALSDPPEELGVGYRVEARVVVWEAPDVVRVPLGALFRTGDGWGVFVVEGGRAHLRRAEVGARGEEWGEVRSGLAEGESVVIYPSDDLKDGTRVRG